MTLRMVCGICGSDNVLRLTQARWDVDRQAWSLEGVWTGGALPDDHYDEYMCCGGCEGEYITAGQIIGEEV
jgi:uncharacterized protein YcnI